jgi:Flp pilus assembly pilin Flp
MKRLSLSRLREFRRNEDGVAAVEFTLVFPIVLFMFVWAVELGLLMTKQVMLEHALDVTMRNLRLGVLPDPTTDTLKREICNRARIIGECESTITIELNPINTTNWQMPNTSVSCVNRDEDIVPVVSFNLGVQNEIMLVRACVIVEPLFPGTGIGAMLQKDAAGGYGMAAVSAFVNEPS